MYHDLSEDVYLRCGNCGLLLTKVCCKGLGTKIDEDGKYLEWRYFCSNCKNNPVIATKHDYFVKQVEEGKINYTIKNKPSFGDFFNFEMKEV